MYKLLLTVAWVFETPTVWLLYFHRGQSLNVFHADVVLWFFGLTSSKSVRLEPELVSFAEFVKMVDNRVPREVRAARNCSDARSSLPQRARLRLTGVATGTRNGPNSTDILLRDHGIGARGHRRVRHIGDRPVSLAASTRPRSGRWRWFGKWSGRFFFPWVLLRLRALSPFHEGWHLKLKYPFHHLWVSLLRVEFVYRCFSL